MYFWCWQMPLVNKCTRTSTGYSTVHIKLIHCCGWRKYHLILPTTSNITCTHMNYDNRVEFCAAQSATTLLNSKKKRAQGAHTLTQSQNFINWNETSIVSRRCWCDRKTCFGYLDNVCTLSQLSINFMAHTCCIWPDTSKCARSDVTMIDC